MTITLTKKIKLSANERFDLLDKIADVDLRDAELQEYLEQVLGRMDDGRVFKGFKTSNTVGAYAGDFIIPASEGVAVTRSGEVCLMDGADALTSPITYNNNNYYHLYFYEEDTDQATRRFLSGGLEVSNVVYTRTTRKCGLYRTTLPSGPTPVLTDFDTTALISGVVRHLIPLWAIKTSAGPNAIDAIYDFRPMFAPAIEDSGGNVYDDVGGNPDLPHNFTPTDSATIGVSSIRDALVAIADRIKQIKGTTYWYDNEPAPLNTRGVWGINGTTLYYNGGNVGALRTMLTVEGGIAIKLTNKTGANSVKGSVVSASTALNYACMLQDHQVAAIGVVYEDGVPDGAEVWVVVQGMADVLLENSTAATRGYWVYCSTVDGRANATLAGPPAGADEHFKEIGHCIQTIGAGTDVLARAVLHFN